MGDANVGEATAESVCDAVILRAKTLKE